MSPTTPSLNDAFAEQLGGSPRQRRLPILCCALVSLALGCTNVTPQELPQPQTETAQPRLQTPPPSPKLLDKNKGSTGIKNSENVPSLTQEELDKRYAEQRACISKCVQSRQMQAVSPETIRRECTQECMKTHFVGQVGVIPNPKAPQEKAPEQEKPK